MLKFKIISDLEEASKLWNLFSHKTDWWDLWEVRQCFIDGKKHPLHFIAGYDEQGEAAGLLPLWFNENEKVYTWLGDDFPENNRLWVKDKSRLNLFLEQCPVQTVLYYLDQEEKKYYNFAESPDHKYFLDLTAYQGPDDWLAGFSKKHRKNLRYDLKNLLAEGFEAKFDSFDRSFIDLAQVMSRFNLQRFGEESLFAEPGFLESMVELMSLAEAKKCLHLVSIFKEGQLVGAEFAVLWNQVYIVMIGGSDPTVDNLNKLLAYQHLANAFALKATKFDLLAGCDWKKQWHFAQEKLYQWQNY